MSNFDLKDLTSRIKKINHIEIFPVKATNLSKAIKFIVDTKQFRYNNKISHNKKQIYNFI